MKLDRFRAPALAAAAVLLISGSGIAFAGSPSAAATAPVAPVGAAEPVGPDTDTLQQGDQTTPDLAGAGSAPAAKAVTISAATAAEKPASETASTSSEGSEATAAESDGPGGHEDPAGQTVDHQFQGEE